MGENRAEERAAGATVEQPSAGPTRREFVTGALAVSGLAWSGLLDVESALAAARGRAADVSVALPAIREIRSVNGRLRGFVTIRSGQRVMPGAARPTLIRYLEGRDAQGTIVWPLDTSEPPRAVPGPTLRARVGDRVELTFLNHVNVAEFGDTIDRVERGITAGCDRVVDGATGTVIYPDKAGDGAPNCFHGSSTSNLHFHGTHVTPDGLGDNVLMQLRPDPRVTMADVKADFDAIFAAGPPSRWSQLPESWRQKQLGMLGAYDDTAPWRGVNGTPGNPALPPEMRLLPPTERLIAAGQWPQYQIGAYPYNFELTKLTEGAEPRYQMGQAPGTHWYHAHKHGSTAINVYNGMAGAFIIEGEYDDALRRVYPDLVEHVLLVQNYAAAPGLMRGGGPPPALWVNGEQTPTLTLRPGEVQLWRMVNASVRAVTTIVGFRADGDTPASLRPPEMRQAAQDGVQFSWANFRDQPRLTPAQTHAARANSFAAGNRVDLLVRAPDTPGTWTFVVNDTTRTTGDATLLKVRVEGTNAGMQYPTEQQWPAFPAFLGDIAPGTIRISRKLDFGWEPGRSTTGRDSAGHAPVFMVDGRQFEGSRYDQTMVLGDTEEWTLLNTTATIAHPFHIHVNPFQVVEVYDPTTGTRYAPNGGYLWQDVVAIPPARFDNGRMVEAGSVRIRHRFADFTGSYVLHCHMLAHEDRGMMQLLRVIPDDTMVPHH